MRDKRLSEEEVVAELRSGMTIGIGGWGSRRKPMSLIRAIARSGLQDLTLVSYGGPDVGVLCATGQVKRVVYAFVSLDTIALDPHFRVARQAGTVEDEPWDEGLFLLGLQAAAWRVPFLPSRVGLGSDLLRLNPRLAIVRSPFADGEELVAAPALELDAALCHLDRADARGNACFLGPDLYFDDLFLRAAARRYISTEKVVATEDLLSEAGTEQRLRIHRGLVDGVVERRDGAHFTDCRPDYERDETFQKEYAAAASSPEAWAGFRTGWIDLAEDDYQARVAAR
ncbi:MAG: CoA transferase subunit A [Acidimicrobiales bacterium]